MRSVDPGSINENLVVLCRLALYLLHQETIAEMDTNA